MTTESLALWIQKARKHFEAGEYKEAESFLTRILYKQPTYADIHNMLGVVLIDQGRNEEAERCFQKAIAINPNYTEAALNLSILYNDQGKYQDAKEIYGRVIANSYQKASDGRAMDPFARGKIANTHAELGDAYVSILCFEEAVNEYKKALNLCPSFADIRTKLANTLRDIGQTETAIEEYRRVKKDKPSYLPARLSLGVALYSLGRIEEAKVEWQECVSMAPTDRRATSYLKMMPPPRSDSQ